MRHLAQPVLTDALSSCCFTDVEIWGPDARPIIKTSQPNRKGGKRAGGGCSLMKKEGGDRRRLFPNKKEEKMAGGGCSLIEMEGGGPEEVVA